MRTGPPTAKACFPQRLNRENSLHQKVLNEFLTDNVQSENESDTVLRTAIWIVSDTSSKLFNKEVPTSVSGSVATFTFRQHVGIACVEGEWISCEYVELDDRPAWLDAKRAGDNEFPRKNAELANELDTSMVALLKDPTDEVPVSREKRELLKVEKVWEDDSEFDDRSPA